MLIRAEGLTRSFGEKDVIVSATLELDKGDRIGLVGDNGSGKTTLIRMLMGELRADSGELTARTERIGYLPQFPDLKKGIMVKDVIGAPYGHLSKLSRRISQLEELMADPGRSDVDWASIGYEYSRLQVEYSSARGHYFSSFSGVALEEVGLEKDIMERPFEQLSGGERTKVLLARVLVQAKDVDLLFLDEPTSHLDIETIEWLENYLIGVDCCVVVISHDRYFLDNVVTTIVEIREGRAKRYIGNYSEYLMKTDLEYEMLSKEARKRRLERERQAKVVEEQKRRWNYISTSKARKKAAETTGGMEGPAQRTEMDVDIKEKGGGGKNLIMASDLMVLRDGKAVIREAELDVEMGDKLGIFGPNGSGKSTLVQGLMGRLRTRGNLWIAPGARVGYFAQGHDDLDPELTAEEQLLLDLGKDNRGPVRMVLSRFEIKGKDAERKISTLSGGERARVSLAHLIARRRNLLVLDEPTNYLDIRSRTAVEKALSLYKGAIVLVTHDRYLLDHLCNKIGILKDGVMRTYTGNYSQVRGQRDLDSLIEQAEVYKVVSKFTDWGTKTRYRAGDKITIAFSEMDRFQEAMDLGYLKRVRGNELKRVRKEE
ncbi:MAG: ABC-F family ATP-binding cassette domain-containing protein [Candidatus Thermoplasmatota archaeon]|nr:ABC-F family ATP-binding cassette domain-containing protein [Candidatus Thermoplasmatota archaeon]